MPTATTHQCTATTKSGERCKNKMKEPRPIDCGRHDTMSAGLADVDLDCTLDHNNEHTIRIDIESVPYEIDPVVRCTACDWQYHGEAARAIARAHAMDVHKKHASIWRGL